MKKYLLPLVLAGAAFAQSSTSVSTSTTKLKKSTLDKIKENTSMSYFSILAGPGLRTPTDTNTLDENNNPEVGSPMNTWNQLSLRYQITKDVRFVINPRFTQYFGRRESKSGKALSNTEGLNPVTGFTIRHQFTDKFSYSGGFNAVFAHVEPGTIDNGLLTNPGGFQTFSYKVNDKLNVGSWVWGRYSIYNSAKLNDDSKKWDFYVAPFAEYSIADNMWLRGWVGKDWDHEAGEDMLATVNRGHDAGLGIDIGINKHFGMYPYITMRWGDTSDDNDVLTTNSAAIGAWFYGSIF